MKPVHLRADSARETSTPSEPFRALIVDDEPLARVNIRVLLEKQDDWRIVGEAGSGNEARDEIFRCRPDVVFLDIRMPGLGGLDLARWLADAETQALIVFVTAFEQHAIEAFEVQAADYLIKPFQKHRFVQALRRLERRLLRRRSESGVAATAKEAAPVDESTRCLAVKSVGRIRLVEVSSIHWIAAAGNYVRLYLADACYLHRSTLSSLEKELDSSVFLRIHRSTLVNRRQVVELRSSIAGRYQLVLHDETELEISQRYKQRVFAELVPGT